MALFSKTDLREALFVLQSHLEARKIAELALKLDKTDERSISTEWEVITLKAFADLGKIEYEKEGAGKCPDLWLRLDQSDLHKLVGDIQTVSDSGRKDGNLRKFKKRLREELGKRRLNPSNVSISLREFHKPYVIQELIDNVQNFLDQIASNNTVPAKYRSAHLPVELEFHPGKSTTTDMHTITSYKRLQANPFYNALDDKRDQLKNIGAVPKGIFLADGGSEMFFFRETCALWFGSDDVIKAFLNRHPDIDFVVTLQVSREPDANRHYPIKTRLFKNSGFCNLDARIQSRLESLDEHFPSTIMQIDVALNCIAEGTVNRYVGAEKLVPLFAA